MAPAWRRGRAHSRTHILSPAIPCLSFCRGGGGKAWAGLLAMRDPGNFQDHCPMMEVGLLVRVPDSPTAAPDQAGQYQIPVSIKGGYISGLGGFRL